MGDNGRGEETEEVEEGKRETERQRRRKKEITKRDNEELPE